MVMNLSIHNGQYVIEHGREPAFAPLAAFAYEYINMYGYINMASINLLKHLHVPDPRPHAAAELVRQSCRMYANGSALA